MDLGLRDKICIVTGSTGGIGLETARLLAGEGARVVVTGRDPGRVEEARETAERCPRGRLRPRRAGSARATLVAEAVEALGGLDCLVNNLGVAYQRSFEEVTDLDWEEQWQLNVMSCVRSIRAALPALSRARGGGAIVNVSSSAGKRPSTSMPDYSVLKAAQLSLSRLVADLYARRGHPLQRGHPGPDGDGGLARTTAGWPTSGPRSPGRRVTRCSTQSARAGRWGDSREPGRSPR